MTPKQIAQHAINYIRFYSTPYGMGFSFDSNKYAQEIIKIEIKKNKTKNLANKK